MPPRRSPDTITDPARAPATPTVEPLFRDRKRRELRDHTSMKPLEFVAWIMAVPLGFFIGSWFSDNYFTTCPSGQRVALQEPYPLNSGYAYTANLLEFQQISDSMGTPQRSTVVLCEDGRVLGPAHSQPDEIGQLGRGRFSHWDTYVVFSASDNSDPNANGREYVAVLPDKH